MAERTIEELKTMQNLPLCIKIEKSKQRIREFTENIGDWGIHVSFSGGKDSTALLHLVRSIYPNTKGVFFNTGMERKGIVEYVKKQANIDVRYPKKSFATIVKEYGYPFPSKRVAANIMAARGNGSLAHIAKKYAPLCKSDCPYKVTAACCYWLKKAPARAYDKETHTHPIIGIRAEETQLRTQAWLQHGCNTFAKYHTSSAPLSFWTEQDILEYLYINNVQLAPDYGKIEHDKDGFHTTGINTSGCVGCLFPNAGAIIANLEYLRKCEPNRYNFLMDKLGYSEFLAWLGENKCI